MTVISLDSISNPNAPRFNLSPGQLEAKNAVIAWYDKFRKLKAEKSSDLRNFPIFKLFGYAGTGKSTVVGGFVNELHLGRVCYATFTGKAAMVLRSKGSPASTIHSLIYKPVEPDKEKCEKLYADIRRMADPVEKKRLQSELEKAQKVSFELKEREESDLNRADLLVLDECSMVNGEMLQDLRSYGVPILALGDPGQLPPIDGTGVLVTPPANAFLTEIHRQAADNPIIDFATRARSGIPIPYGARGSSSHIRQATLRWMDLLTYDQILTGKNNTRQHLNKQLRKAKGFISSVYPLVGEKVICLKNSTVKNTDGGAMQIFNGMLGQVVSVGNIHASSIELTIRMETQKDSDPPAVISALLAHFDSYSNSEALKEVKWWDRRDTQEFDFGYAITVHKSQGSQWENVLFWDDNFLVWDKAERKKWLYTGITRASNSITIVD